jgi:hypothetical protein
VQGEKGNAEGQRRRYERNEKGKLKIGKKIF